MAAKGIPLHKFPHFTTTLSSAALEWLLMFLLFIHAIFSYWVTQFARYCDLQVPCLLCSRLDHILGCEKIGFYWDLICPHHKLEISSLVVCHVHNKLVDVQSICENCLFSFEDHKHSGCSKRICSCCNEPYILRNHVQNFPQSRLDFNDLNRKETIQKLKGYDPLPHVKYSKMKNVSDTESEVPISDDDDAEKLTDLKPELSLLDLQGQISNNDHERGKHDIRTGLEEISRLHVKPEVDVSHTTTNSEIHMDSRACDVLVPQVEESEVCETVELEQISSKQGPHVEINPVIETDKVEQISIEKVDCEENKSVLEREAAPETPSIVNNKITKIGELEQTFSEKVPREEIKPVIDRDENDKVAETVELKQASSEKFVPGESLEIPSVVKDKITETGELEQSITEKITNEEIKPVIAREKVTESIESDQISSEKVTHENTKVDIERAPSSDMLCVVNDSVTQLPDNLELSESYKLPVANNRRQFSGKLLKQMSVKETSEDMKLLILQQRICLERNESGLSLDGSFEEVEGESEFDRLKRQVEHDKRLMGDLCKELEEERNASTIAANQAMAMITRLQEEKASLQMEALQCVRMMEEQAEYDVEALQKANDLLSEKEKEIQDLEAELEYFRGDLEDKNSENVESNSTVDKPHAFSKDDLTYNSYSEFEEERLFVLECLRKLEKKLLSYDTESTRTREQKEVDLKEPNAVAIGDAVSNLIRRLEAIEADSNGIESLKTGDKEIEQNSGDSLSQQDSTKE